MDRGQAAFFLIKIRDLDYTAAAALLEGNVTSVEKTMHHVGGVEFSQHTTIYQLNSIQIYQLMACKPFSSSQIKCIFEICITILFREMKEIIDFCFPAAAASFHQQKRWPLHIQFRTKQIYLK